VRKRIVRGRCRNAHSPRGAVKPTRAVVATMSNDLDAALTANWSENCSSACSFAGSVL